MADIEKEEIGAEDEGPDTEDVIVDAEAGEELDVVGDVEVEIEEPKETMRECKGLFAKYPVEDFTQDEKYCDTYLKQRGLFKGE